jgi:hypothetical protein
LAEVALGFTGLVFTAYFVSRVLLPFGKLLVSDAHQIGKA